MNCTCIDDINKEMIGQEIAHKIITKAQLLGVAFLFNNAGTTTYTEMEYEYEGCKRPKKINIMHTFCPFCGVKIEKPKE
ncbi:MAG: hypothetical protein PHT07_21440 [Paludibacter sp.]|nr:hypothetical protein [Paludibacter sp.]